MAVVLARYDLAELYRVAPDRSVESWRIALDSARPRESSTPVRGASYTVAPRSIAVLAQQSGIPKRRLVLVDRHETYSHNDPNSASPKNDFVKKLIPFRKKVARR